MQIRAIVLYSRTGKRRIVELQPGGLNVITGVQRSGKSALLDIVEFCLGRNTLVMPVGPITQTVGWYALLLEHGDTRVFVARPAPKEGAATTQQAMIELAADLEYIEFDDLQVNADTHSIRQQLGRLIGIDENAGEAHTPWAQAGLEANLGHATWLCLQGQNEIAHRSFLFHRQGEDEIATAIRETLPYFLGAVPAEQAMLRQMLTTARRELRRAETDLERARTANEEIDVSLLGMLREAVGAGLLPDGNHDGRAEMFDALRSIEQTEAPVRESDDVTAGRRERLERERGDLRGALRAAGAQVELIATMGQQEDAYARVVDSQISRLSSLDLLGDANGEDSCPACARPLADEAGVVGQMRGVAETLAGQLEGVEAIRPRRAEAARDLDAAIDGLRQKLRATDAALAGLVEQDRTLAPTRSAAESQAFTRGRIQHFLDTTSAADGHELQRLADRVRVRDLAVRGLEERLDPDATREELSARLAVVGSDMTRFSQMLKLEYTGAVWLDLKRLTVMTETPQGAAPLFRVGSAENWMGYHLVAHLALHRYFTRHERPVPRFLMLDQPTQAYYPSEMEQVTGLPEGEDDRAAVHRLFELMRDVTVELGAAWQLIVCDHANLPEDWFQAAVGENNWRGGLKLIPQEWIEEAEDRDGEDQSPRSPSG